MSVESPAYASLRAQMEKRLQGLDDQSPERRRSLYSAARETLATRYPQHLETFELVVTDLERRFDQPQSAEPLRDQAETLGVSEEPAETAAATMRSNAGLPSRWVLLPVIAGLALAAAGGVWYFAFSAPSEAEIAEFAAGVTGYSAAAFPIEQIPDDIRGYERQTVDGDETLRARGDFPLYRMAETAIDPQKLYRVCYKIRVLRDDPDVGGAKTYVGVATYDPQGSLQTDAPGAHRYAGLSGRVITASEGWVEGSGEIMGTGNQSANQFRENTRTVRPLALLNYASPKAVSEIAYLRFEEVR